MTIKIDGIIINIDEIAIEFHEIAIGLPGNDYII